MKWNKTQNGRLKTVLFTEGIKLPVGRVYCRVTVGQGGARGEVRICSYASFHHTLEWKDCATESTAKKWCENVYEKVLRGTVAAITK